MKERSSITTLFVHYRDDTSLRDVLSLRSGLESGAAGQLSYEVSEKLFHLSSRAPPPHKRLVILGENY